jgi:hypothetical protein
MRLGTPPSVRRTHDGAALFALDASVSRAARLTAGMDDEEERTVGLLLLGKGAVSAHRFDRPSAAGLDDREDPTGRSSETARFTRKHESECDAGELQPTPAFASALAANGIPVRDPCPAIRATQRRAPCRDARSVRKAGAAGADGAASELRPLPATGGAAAETTASQAKAAVPDATRRPSWRAQMHGSRSASGPTKAWAARLCQPVLEALHGRLDPVEAVFREVC